MNKLITKRIKSIESKLVSTNNEIAFESALPDSLDSVIILSELTQRRDALDVALDFHTKMSPEEITRDVMPAEVALELLCSPGVPLSNRMRKNCLDARATYYQSVRERKPGAVKLASRLKSAKLTQLGKWLRRAAARSARVTKHLTRLAGQDNKQTNYLRQILQIRGIELSIARAAMNEEIYSRV